MSNLMMDETSLRVKNIIEPYENKIKELEEIIKNKNFEIAVLKEKLNNNNLINSNFRMNLIPQINNNINPMMFMNMNQMLNMNPLMDSNMDMNSQEKGWTIKFEFKQKSYTEKCPCDEKVKALKKRIRKKLNLKRNAIFTLCGKKLHPDLTVAQSGMSDNCVIQIIGETESSDSDSSSQNEKDEEENFKSEENNGPKINILFTTTIGTSVHLVLNHSTSISSAIKLYLKKVKKLKLFGSSDKISFLFKAGKLDHNDKRSI